MKKRKLDSEEESPECDICYQPEAKLINCFRGCTIKTCQDCLEKQIKIDSIRVVFDNPNNFMISYSCSMCKQKCNYLVDPQEEHDKQFTKWVRETPNIANNLLNKFIGTPTTNRSVGISINVLPLSEDEAILSALFDDIDSYIPPASLLPWPYRLIHPPIQRQSPTQQEEPREPST